MYEEYTEYMSRVHTLTSAQPARYSLCDRVPVQTLVIEGEGSSSPMCLESAQLLELEDRILKNACRVVRDMYWAVFS